MRKWQKKRFDLLLLNYQIKAIFTIRQIGGIVMKAHELREKQLPELNRELVSLLKAHFGLRMQLATQRLYKY